MCSVNVIPSGPLLIFDPGRLAHMYELVNAAIQMTEMMATMIVMIVIIMMMDMSLSPASRFAFGQAWGETCILCKT